MNHRFVGLAAALIAAGFIGFGNAQTAHAMNGMHEHEHHHDMKRFPHHDNDHFRRHHRDSGYDSHYSPWCTPRIYGAPYGGRHYYCEPAVYLF